MWGWGRWRRDRCGIGGGGDRCGIGGGYYVVVSHTGKGSGKERTLQADVNSDAMAAGNGRSCNRGWRIMSVFVVCLYTK